MPPLNPSGGQAWHVAASPAERWALVNVYLDQKTKVTGQDARKHRRLRDALQVGHIIGVLKANKDRALASKVRDESTYATYTITVENLEWFAELLKLAPMSGEQAVLLDGLLERCEQAKAGAEPSDAPPWSADTDDWAPPAATPKAEPDEITCPSCRQSFHPSEATKPNEEARPV